MRTILILEAACFWLLIAACSTMQSRFVPLDSAYSSRAPDCKIDFYKESMPSRKFSRIARIDVHLENTFFVSPSYKDVLPELTKQACLSGADAVIDILERSDHLVENKSYHVTAIGIKYLE